MPKKIKTMWFVVGNATGKSPSVWLSTASFQRRRAIQLWQEQQPDRDYDWRYWYRHGFRVRRVSVKCRIHR